MISGKELRINNWVFDSRSISTYPAKNILLVKKVEDIIYKYYNPIPITPEILVQNCGFKRDEYREGNSFTIWLGLSCFRINQEAISKTWYGIPGSPITKINSLHLLQNLVFALYSEELPVKFSD